MLNLNLGTRVMLGLVIFGGSWSFLTVQVVDYTNDAIEETILNEFLMTEFSNLQIGPIQETNPEMRQKPAFKTYFTKHDVSLDNNLPQPLENLSPGFHEDIIIEQRPHYVLVKDAEATRFYVTYDITHIEEEEDEQELVLLFGTVIIILASLIFGFFLARILVSPINALAQQVRKLDPAARGTRLTNASRMEEVVVIVMAINGFMDRLDGFVEREQEFSATVSHELRTPIAVISTSTDVLEALHNLPRSATRPIRRIERATQDMKQVITALLYLAKEAPFVENGEETCHLDKIIPKIVEDHHHLIKNKNISVKILRVDPTLVSAPQSILVIAIGNIVRNAIEHTEEGVVEITLQNGILNIRNSSQDLSPEKAAHLFHERIRNDSYNGEGKGLGIYIIKRICTHFGWDFSIESDAYSGTTVKLNLAMNIVEPG